MALRQSLILGPLAGLAFWVVLFVSWVGNDSACDGAFWTTGWVFLPPVLAIPGFYAARPFRAGAILAAVALLGLWGVFFGIWLVVALACGVNV